MYRGPEPVAGGRHEEETWGPRSPGSDPGRGRSETRVGGGRSSRVQGWQCRDSKRGFGRRSDPRSRSWLGFPTGPRSTDIPGRRGPARGRPTCAESAAIAAPSLAVSALRRPIHQPGVASARGSRKPRGPAPFTQPPPGTAAVTGSAAAISPADRSRCPAPPRPGQPIHRPLRLLAPPTVEE